MSTDSTTQKNQTLSYLKHGIVVFTTLFSLSTTPGLIQAQNCPNVDFSTGTFANWQGRTGTCCPINLPTTGFVAGRHTIIAAAGTDPFTGGGLVLPAPGFAQVARLGNPVNGAEAEGLSYTILVDPTNALFIYTYAVVLEDPGHAVADQPRFELQVRDQNNNIIPCTFYEVAAGAGIPGFQTTGGVVWKNWEQVGVDLSAYMGQTITIEARTGDCALGGHFGYGYLVGECQPLEIGLNFCSGASTANLSAPNGFASYLWSTGETTQNITITNPTIGQIVTCTVTSITGCQAVLSVTLTPILVTGTINSTNVSCFGGNNGSATVTPTGGTGPYTYAWAPSGGNAATANNLTAGNYTVTITEAGNNCTGTATVTITQPATPVNIIGTVTNVACNGGNSGAMDITASNGTPAYTYNWNNGSITEDVNALTPGTYSVICTDANGCTATFSGTVTQPAAAITNTITNTNVTCFGGNNGSVDITPSGGTPGYSYAWSNGATTQDISGVAIGNYTVTVTDINGCTALSVGVITQPTAVSPVPVSYSVNCFGGNNGAIVLTTNGGTPGYTFVWNNGALTGNISGLTGGTYSVIATDANGCTGTASAFISQPANALNVAGISTNINCFGNLTGSIDVSVSGGTGPYGYLWSSGNITQDLSNLGPGTYNLTVTDLSGCINNSFSATITEPAAALTVTGFNNNILCFGANTGSIDITPAGGTLPYNYNWNNGATTQDITNLSPGVYNLILTDANGCTNNTYSGNISQPAAALTISGTTTNVLCSGLNTGAINVTPSGGTPLYTYSWSNGSTTQDLSNIPAGTYNLTVTDASGCTNNSYSVTIFQPSAALFVNGNPTNPTCYGTATGSIDATPGGGTPPYTYQWNIGPDTQDLTNLSSGGYTLTVTDGNGCSANGAWGLIDPALLAMVPSIQPSTCYGIKDALISLNISGGVPPYNALWNTGAINTTLMNVGPGNYSVTVTDANGCTTSGAYLIPTTAPLTIDLELDSLYLIWLGESVELTAVASGGTGDLAYSWGPPEHLSCTDCPSTNASPLLNTHYAVTVTDQNGCTAVTGAYIEIMFALYIPNTFTPNGDGDNDEFFAISASVKNFTLRIFNRWGEEVFTTNDIHDGWNGIYHGLEAKQDVYVFRVEATFMNGKYEEIVGQVNLLR
jgi:gliding motility-associated-like protein